LAFRSTLNPYNKLAEIDSKSDFLVVSGRHPGGQLHSVYRSNYQAILAKFL
jgi:hypothetical protein